MLSCNDICDKLVEKLLAAGFEIDTATQDHHDIWKALNECIIHPKGRKGEQGMALGIHPDVLEWLENGEAPKHCECGEKQLLHFFYRDHIGDYDMAGNGHWSPCNLEQVDIEVECLTCNTVSTVGHIAISNEIQVVVALDGGLLQDIWAYTESKLAEAKQAEQDKLYRLVRDEKGNIANEDTEAQVITFVLKLDEDQGGKEASWMDVQGMGPVSPVAFTPMTSEPQSILLSPDDVRDMLDFIAEAEDKGMDLKEVERVRAILGYPIL